MIAYCSACKIEVPDLEVNHHVCVVDDKGNHTATTRDEAGKARERSIAQDITVPAALALDLAEAAAAKVAPAPDPAPIA